MARIRTIKPEFWEDEDIAQLPMQARLMFIGCWNFADDYGVLLNSIKYLKSKIFPYDESLREQQLKMWLDALTNARMLIPFDLNGKSYLYIRTFNSHQIIDKRYSKSILPKDFNLSEFIDSLIIEKTHSEHIVNTALPHCEHIVTTMQESRVEERRGKGNVSIEIVFPFESENFKKWWQIWKDYKKDQHKFIYKSPLTEQATLKELGGLAGGNEEIAIKIIEQSISKSWKGLFKLNNNGKGTSNYGQQQPTSIDEATRIAGIYAMYAATSNQQKP